MRRRRKTKNKLIIRLTALLIFLIIAIRAFKITLSRYESEGDGSAKVEIAKFLLNTDYQSMTIKLDSITPGSLNTYEFSIANYEKEIDEDEKEIITLTDTIISYDLTIRATTNLPLDFELYLNNDQAISAIANDEIIQDEHGTYFRVLTTERQTFGFEEVEENKYKLNVTLPSYCSAIEYQDIIDAIEISIKSEQVTAASNENNEDNSGD